jgi:ABC-type Zn uptake system ZnuABC Zn-binding protein ZnuA
MLILINVVINFQKQGGKMRDLDKEVFQYLDDLREAGFVNMYGAWEYLMHDFDMFPNQAKEFVFEWMKDKELNARELGI